MEYDTDNRERCKRCDKECDPYQNPAVRCDDRCQKLIHVSCLNRGTLPSNLLGDVFYDLYCSECSDTGEESFVRQKLSWLMAIVLVLYNLREISYRNSNRGYFHYSRDICKFILDKWDIIFTPAVKQRKQWRGTVSGTLSANKEFFKSGTDELQEAGYWKLIPKDAPEIISNLYAQLKKHKTKGEIVSSEIIANTNEVTTYEQESTSGVPSSISSQEDFEDMDIDAPNVDEDFTFNLIENTVEESLTFLDGNKLSDMLDSDCFDSMLNQQDEDLDINTVPNFEIKQNSNNEDYECDSNKNNESCKINDLPVPEPSLFNQSKRQACSLNEPSVKISKESIKPLMTERQEEYLLQKLESHKNLLNVAPASVVRLYRKLKVRKEKRQIGLPVFNLDKFGKTEQNNKSKKKTNILDKFMPEDFNVVFEQRLQGTCELTPIYIPDVDRKLDPLIWRYPSCPAPFLKVMNELLTKVNHKKSKWESQVISTVDFSYVRPQHIPAMNSLCSQFFWPGVDLTECLQHPHTTCVALYKKLVVGFAVMVPDVSFNEAYISFLFVRPEWQRAKIGTFMLYHLTQTVWTKDITLHVSVTNPAMALYSKFGFQVESFIKNFYDKYIPPSSKESKDAFFLRLK